MSAADEAPGRRASGRYGSLSDFYEADPARLDSRELDVGLWWREERDGPLYRAAWVCDTGELYLATLGPSADGGGAVEVLGQVHRRERLEQALAGWREQCGRPASLRWLRSRASRLPRRNSGRTGPRLRPTARSMLA